MNFQETITDRRTHIYSVVAKHRRRLRKLLAARGTTAPANGRSGREPRPAIHPLQKADASHSADMEESGSSDQLKDAIFSSSGIRKRIIMICFHDGARTPGEMAQLLSCTLAGILTQVDTLMNAGVVSHERRRNGVVRLTPEANAIVNAAIQRGREQDAAHAVERDPEVRSSDPDIEIVTARVLREHYRRKFNPSVVRAIAERMAMIGATQGQMIAAIPRGIIQAREASKVRSFARKPPASPVPAPQSEDPCLTPDFERIG